MGVPGLLAEGLMREGAVPMAEDHSEDIDLNEMIRQAEAINRESEARRASRASQDDPSVVQQDSTTDFDSSSVAGAGFTPDQAGVAEPRDEAGFHNAAADPRAAGAFEASLSEPYTPPQPNIPHLHPAEPTLDVPPTSPLQSSNNSRSIEEVFQQDAVLKPRKRWVGLLLGFPFFFVAQLGVGHFYYRRPGWGIFTFLWFILTIDGGTWQTLLWIYLGIEWLMLLAGADRYKIDGKGVPIKRKSLSDVA